MGYMGNWFGSFSAIGEFGEQSCSLVFLSPEIETQLYSVSAVFTAYSTGTLPPPESVLGYWYVPERLPSVSDTEYIPST